MVLRLSLCVEDGPFIERLIFTLNFVYLGHFGLKMGVQLLDNQHMVTVSPTHILTSPSTLLPVTNTTNNTYTTGNLTFVPKPEVGEGNSSVQLYRYVYVYDYGDNSSVEEQSDFNSTHYYERPGNYSYSVEGFALYVKDIRRAYYAVHRGQITILGKCAVIAGEYSGTSNTTLSL